jgi:hypothetical protein
MRYRGRLVRALLGATLLAAAVSLSQAQAQQAQIPAASASDEERFAKALQALHPQRPGVVDAYVVVAALDTDPVFGREAREAGRVLASRFDATGRTIVLATDEGSDLADATASPEHLAAAIRRQAELMDKYEDVLVLYTTSHGSPHQGLNYRDPARGAAIIAPEQLAQLLNDAGPKNRLIILQACYAGQFIPALAGPRTIVATAAAAMNSSFGCSAGNDWTFFGYALIDLAMRQPDTFVRQFRRAYVNILGWEKKLGFHPSNPQISVGSGTAGWMATLDSRAPKTPSAPVGKPPSEITN